MKKLKISTLVLLTISLGVLSRAQQSWEYAFQDLVVPELTGSEIDGDGAGWYASLFLASDVSSQLDNTTVAAYLSVFDGYYISSFNSTLEEGSEIFLRVYDNTDAELASNYIDTQNYVLQNLEFGYTPGAQNVTLSFTGQTWQAVPEPTTFFLFTIGGVGAWIVRRNKLKSKEEEIA